MFGLLAPNGAGKSSTVKMIIVLPVTSGILKVLVTQEEPGNQKRLVVAQENNLTTN